MWFFLIGECVGNNVFIYGEMFSVLFLVYKVFCSEDLLLYKLSMKDVELFVSFWIWIFLCFWCCLLWLIYINCESLIICLLFVVISLILLCSSEKFCNWFKNRLCKVLIIGKFLVLLDFMCWVLILVVNFIKLKCLDDSFCCWMDC